MTTATTKPANNRLLALDVLRGITIAGMILVNNPGSWSNVYAPLCHAEWSGLTPTDLVFPFFMFIMGVSSYFSLRKYDFKFSWPTIFKIVRRSVLLFAIGFAIAWFARIMWGVAGGKAFTDVVFDFTTVRTLGVIPRLAICYGIGSLLGIIFSRKALGWIIAIMLIVYAFCLIFGNGYAFDPDNIIVRVDKAVLGEAHMYSDHVNGVSMKFDPEGFLSTLPSIAHMLIGFLVGGMIIATKNNEQRITKLFILGTILTFAGFLLDYGLPINKKVWSPTFVLTTCGLASSLLALLIWIIDIKGHRSWSQFFQVFGINPLFLYCLSTVLAVSFDTIHLPAATESGFITIKGIVYRNWLMNICDDNAILASLFYAILFVMLNWLVGLILYRKKIYIKL